LPARACGIAAACTGVGTKNFAAFNRSFNEGATENSENPPSEILCPELLRPETLCSEILVILLSCRVRLPLHTHFRCARQSALPDLFLFTLKTTENSKGGYSQIRSAPEGPHNTTAALSATSVYHTFQTNPLQPNHCRVTKTSGRCTRCRTWVSS